MRTVDKAKKANMKCEYCEHLNRPKGTVYDDCTCKLTGTPKKYWNRCKRFAWRKNLNYKGEINNAVQSDH